SCLFISHYPLRGSTLVPYPTLFRSRDLLAHAAQRDRVDVTLHTLYGQARRDWALNRLLTGAVKDPFRGTAIAAYMKGFEQRRSNRFHAHFDMSPELVFDKRDDIKGGTS